MKQVRNVYDLEGSLHGRRLWVLAPGPSSEALETYGERLRALGEPVLALNSALELWPDPTWWFYSDKRFSWLYGDELVGRGSFETPRSIVVPHSQTKKLARRFAGETIHSFEFEHRITRYHPDRNPFWWCRDRRFLAGRSSVILPALSFAELLKPYAVILVGVDFLTVRGQYYHAKISRKNPGPTYRERALDAGRKHLAGALKKGTMWPSLLIRTTSPFLASQMPIDHVPWERALDGP